jgi:Stage II sporulation protein E (SpoIIE)
LGGGPPLRAAGIPSGVAAGVSGTVAAGGGGEAGAGGLAAKAGAHRAGRGSGSHAQITSALAPAIRIVERIANVVPTGVWILVGILGALSCLLAGRSWLSSSRARRLERQRRHLAEEVGLLQAALLPVIPPRLGRVAASVAYRPAEGPAAGGDFYDLFALEDGRVAVIVGDISGHGPSALPQTALIRYTLRTYLDAGLSPRAALHAGAATLDHQLGDSFATVALATYDASERTLTYACAGHPPPLVIAPEPLEPVLVGAAPPLGAGLPTGYRQTILRLPASAQICFFTDGIIEARAGGELFGIERLAQMLARLGPAASAEALLEHVVAATDRRPDDMAACVLRLDERTQRGAQAPHGSTADAEGVLRSEELEIDQAALGAERTQRFLAACGLPTARIAEAMSAARAVVEPAGEALLRLRFHEPLLPEVEVLPHNTGVLRLGPRAGLGATAASLRTP